MAKCCGLWAVGLLIVAGCGKPPAPVLADREEKPTEGTALWKIANARSAAPQSISGNAKIVDWPDAQGKAEQLVLGGNGWTCLPDNPRTPANDPLCVDAMGMTYQIALVSHQPPRISGAGMLYYLQGGNTASDTDPTKLAPDAGQQWGIEQPHLMMVLPTPLKAYPGLPTTRQTDRPWVKYAGTPWAVMIIPAAQRK